MINRHYSVVNLFSWVIFLHITCDISRVYCVCMPTTVGITEIACGFIGKRKAVLQDSGQCGGWGSKSYLLKVNPSCFWRKRLGNYLGHVHFLEAELFFHFLTKPTFHSNYMYFGILSGHNIYSKELRCALYFQKCLREINLTC